MLIRYNRYGFSESTGGHQMSHLLQFLKGKKIRTPHSLLEKHKIRERKEMARAIILLSERKNRTNSVRKLMIS